MSSPYDAMYQTQRVGLDAFKADVPDGVYEVTLHFAELLTKEQQQKLIYNLQTEQQSVLEFTGREFDVSINGTVFLQDLSYKNYIEPVKAYSTKTFVTVKNGENLAVMFTPKQGEAFLNGIQIRKIY